MRASRAAAARPLPEAVARAAELHLLDAIGVGLAAAGSPIGECYRKISVPDGPSTVFGKAKGAPPADAAMVNGGLIHSLEFDDTHTGSIAHGSSVLAAVSLAVSESKGLPTTEMLAAYARAWEVLVRIGLAAPGRFQARGFQVTSVGGTLAAALLAAELNDLNEEESLNALGIALSQASGVLEFLTNGSSVKSLHPGWAAHAGVLAADFARAGMTGPETSLEGRFGLFRHFAGDEDAPQRFGRLLEDLGTSWHLPQAAFKFYPCCHYLHPFIEAAGMLEERGVKPDAVGRIMCRVPAGAALVICEPWEAKLAPETGHAARWSLPITVAARLAEGEVGLATFEAPPSPAVRKLARLVEWQPLQDARFPERFEAEVECRTAAGKVHTVRIDDVYGNATRPAGADAVMAKFRANAARALAPGIAEALPIMFTNEKLAALSHALRTVRTLQ